MAGITEIISGKWPAVVSWLGNAFSQGEKRWRPLFILLMMALFAWMSVGIFYKVALSLLVLPPLSTVHRVKGAAAPAGGGATSLIYRAIYERNLFGSTEQVWQTESPPAQTGQSARPAEAAAAAAAISLELKGTVAGDRFTAFAAIRERGKPADVLYKIGDTVGGATIKEIRRGEVLLESGGDLITIRMVAAPLVPLAPERGGGAASTSPPVASPPGAGGRITVTRAEVASQLSDMGGLLTQAQIRPFFSAGVPDGFMLSQIRPGSIYEKMTLREGDIIQEVNNRRLKGAEDMIEFYNLLKGAPAVSLRVLREGRAETLNYDLR